MIVKTGKKLSEKMHYGYNFRNCFDFSPLQRILKMKSLGLKYRLKQLRKILFYLNWNVEIELFNIIK